MNVIFFSFSSHILLAVADFFQSQVNFESHFFPEKGSFQSPWLIPHFLRDVVVFLQTFGQLCCTFDKELRILKILDRAFMGGRKSHKVESGCFTQFCQIVFPQGSSPAAELFSVTQTNCKMSKKKQGSHLALICVKPKRNMLEKWK